MAETIAYHGGPLHGQSRPMTTCRYVLVPDYEGSILCATENGPLRCFTMHRYELKTYRTYHGEPYRSDPGYRDYTLLEYVGREAAVPCGPIIGGDQTVFASDDTPILNVPGIA